MTTNTTRTAAARAHLARHPELRSRGPAHGRACHSKLNPFYVLLIRAAVARGDSQIALAKEYGVSRKTISRVVHGVSWKLPAP